MPYSYVGITELRQNLPKAVADLQEEPLDSFFIMRQNKPVGVLVSIETWEHYLKLLEENA